MDEITWRLGVRFISVSEGIDTEKRSADTFEIKIRNLVNTAYAADISEKIAITHKLFQKEGLYEGGYEPYGYKRGTGEDICRLFPDPMTKDIVKSIFTVYKEERTLRAVLRNLAEKRGNLPWFMHGLERYMQMKGKNTGSGVTSLYAGYWKAEFISDVWNKGKVRFGESRRKTGYGMNVRIGLFMKIFVNLWFLKNCFKRYRN